MAPSETTTAARERMASWPGLLSATCWAAIVVQTGFLVALGATDGYDVARRGELSRVLLTYVMVLALFGFVHLASPSPRWARRATAAVFVLFVSINFARFETAGSFDYGFAHANIRELANPLGRQIAFANVQLWEVGCLFVAPLALGVVLTRSLGSPPASRARLGSRLRAAAAFGCFAVLVGLPLARVSTHESLTGFAVSGLRFHAESRDAEATVIKGAPFPYLRELAPSSRGRAVAKEDAPRPHVILLFMESWSALYVGKTRPDGRKLTPVFDAHRHDGLTYDHFYGNSVQSSRGQFATLCSLIPMFRGKEFVDIPTTRLHCLPQQLAEVGYGTMFYSATDDSDFDHSETWLTGPGGFGDVRFAPRRETSHDPAVWGLGVQDDVFYRRFFALLDEKVAREPSKPQFAVLANASHHYPFDKAPHHVADPGPTTRYHRNFLASLTAADAWLATFFDELDKRPAFRDAIVILVGDHSFPADEHGIHFNGLGAYEEAFHTSFVLRWPGHVAPAVVTDRAASQIDLAPTILDLLQVRARTHFVGTSLVATEVDRSPVPLVQPYDGVRLAAVKWPLKLVRHESAQQEQLYDLAKDPEETRDLLADPRLAGELPALRGTLTRIHANDAILRANRVWPSP